MIAEHATCLLYRKSSQVRYEGCCSGWCNGVTGLHCPEVATIDWLCWGGWSKQSNVCSSAVWAWVVLLLFGRWTDTTWRWLHTRKLSSTSAVSRCSTCWYIARECRSYSRNKPRLRSPATSLTQLDTGSNPRHRRHPLISLSIGHSNWPTVY